MMNINSTICTLIFSCLLSSASASFAYDNKYSFNECIKLATNHIEAIDNILINTGSINKANSLRQISITLRECAFVTRETKYESLFNDASGKARQMSVIINDTNDSRMMAILENKHVEITDVLDKIIHISRK